MGRRPQAKVKEWICHRVIEGSLVNISASRGVNLVLRGKLVKLGYPLPYYYIWLWPAPCGHTAHQPLVVTIVHFEDSIDVDIYRRRSDKMIGHMSYNWPWSTKIFCTEFGFTTRVDRLAWKIPMLGNFHAVQRQSSVPLNDTFW